MRNSVIAVVGNGIAGDQAAFAARQTDPLARVVMLSREPHLLYSACVLADYLCDEIPKSNVFLRCRQDYARCGIELQLSRDITAWSPADRRLHFKGGTLSYDQLILATGSRPFIPPIPGKDKKGVFALKSFDDAEQLRAVQGRSAVVVGAGPVGLEAAVAFRRLGWSVALVERMDRVLPRMLDHNLAHSLSQQMLRQGISVFLNEQVEEIEGAGHVEAVRTDRRTLPADVVVLVIGMRPRVELAVEGGLALGPAGGIQTDDYMGTNRPDVWVCGDCVESVDLVTGIRGVHMLWNNARLQGQIAGCNAAGLRKRYPGSLNVTTVKVFERAVASVGRLASDFPEGETRVLHRKTGECELQLVLNENRLVGVQSLGTLDRVGGLTAMMLSGRNIRETILKGPAHSAGWGAWPLYGLEKDLLGLLISRPDDWPGPKQRT